jgi:hypothetical protein
VAEMTLANRVIEAVEWTEAQVLRGTGEELASALRALVESGTNEEAERAWWNIENVAFSQGTIYGAAEPTTDVMLAALADDCQDPGRGWVIEVLYFILSGESRDDVQLSDRCRARAQLGIWLLLREAQRADGEERNRIISIVERVDPSFIHNLRLS